MWEGRPSPLNFFARKKSSLSLWYFSSPAPTSYSPSLVSHTLAILVIKLTIPFSLFLPSGNDFALKAVALALSKLTKLRHLDLSRKYEIERVCTLVCTCMLQQGTWFFLERMECDGN